MLLCKSRVLESAWLDKLRYKVVCFRAKPILAAIKPSNKTSFAENPVLDGSLPFPVANLFTAKITPTTAPPATTGAHAALRAFKPNLESNAGIKRGSWNKSAAFAHDRLSNTSPKNI